MSLPESLKNAIEEEACKIHPETLLKASQQLSQRYRDPSQKQKILQHKEHLVANEAQRIAYILARMPATFGALKYVLEELNKRSAQATFNTVLDIGAGPGTASWAVSEVFPSARNITLLEKDLALINLGKKLSQSSGHPLIKNGRWLQTDLLNQKAFPESDLTLVSYSMGEWPESEREEILRKLWMSCKVALVIVEPGTMPGFDVIRTVRQLLIDWGGMMIAPCPHHLKCPMPEDDWCHFSVRIERSKLHRFIKSGSLSYEDEKFSYVVMAKSAFNQEKAFSRFNLPTARILRHPQKRSGHVSFFLCTQENGLEKKIISRRDGELYKKARDLEWGDTFD